MRDAAAIGSLLLAAGLFAFALTWAYRRYALRRGVLDVPNERSSHVTPTPRGGGVAIATAFIAALGAAWWLGLVPDKLCVALSGAGAWTALLGFIDDRHPLPALARLLAYLVGPLWALAWLGAPPLALGNFGLAGGVFTAVLLLVYGLWLLNLYNFMDGIDGIASLEAVTVAGGAALVYLIALPGTALWAIPLLVAAAAGGFLCWNYPPARIFMGDAGSGFLGITFAVLSVHAAWLAPELFWAWTILLGVFLVDATTTLGRRLLRRKRPHEAHRSHAYQYAARTLQSHERVSLAVAVLNVVWLWPAALLVGTGRMQPLVGLVLAFAPLTWLAFRFKAGAPELQTGADPR